MTEMALTASAPRVAAQGQPEPQSQGWQPLLRRYGLRVTSARVLVLGALQVLGHATPEQVYAKAQPDLPGLNLSTVYRTLEVLAEHRMVTHTHLEQTSASYMLAEHDHAHLVCRGCHAVLELDHDIATVLAGQVSHTHGFDVDIGHLSLFGRCCDCTTTDLAREHADHRQSAVAGA